MRAERFVPFSTKAQASEVLAHLAFLLKPALLGERSGVASNGERREFSEVMQSKGESGIVICRKRAEPLACPLSLGTAFP